MKLHYSYKANLFLECEHDTPNLSPQTNGQPRSNLITTSAWRNTQHFNVGHKNKSSTKSFMRALSYYHFSMLAAVPLAAVDVHN
mmetsp:Transcript_25901/g.48608  ORF Transcript_25901/g.48608 Transcript_25901/m.48608 type:complete len:84 (+) Transcript_25901:93-344(+)